jgi:uncharacterized protein (TIGR02646 family)
MKYVIKKQEPVLFSIWKAKHQNTYDRFKKTSATENTSPKKVVKDALIQAQGYLCCYCECRITSDTSHIEHFRPQSHPDVDPLDFSNLLCSCQKDWIAGSPCHCGNLKLNWFDPILLISPFEPNCEDRFKYTFDGWITPVDTNDEAARQTIDKLGLNIPKLIDMRRQAIEPFIDLEDLLSQSELQQFIIEYLHQDSGGMFGEFWTTIKYLFY